MRADEQQRLRNRLLSHDWDAPPSDPNYHEEPIQWQAEAKKSWYAYGSCWFSICSFLILNYSESITLWASQYRLAQAGTLITTLQAQLLLAMVGCILGFRGLFIAGRPRAFALAGFLLGAAVFLLPFHLLDNLHLKWW